MLNDYGTALHNTFSKGSENSRNEIFELRIKVQVLEQMIDKLIAPKPFTIPIEGDM